MGRWIWFCFYLMLTLGLQADDIGDSAIPPPNLPVEIKTGFRLVRLISINEREQTFYANIYFNFKWFDSRLAFTPKPEQKAKIYVEEAVPDQLNQMWWPQIEFMNTNSPVFNNRTLFIFPDGQVEYYMGMTGNFRFPADFKRFPFDTQTLQILVDSFVWSDNICVFIPASVAIETPEEQDVNPLHQIISIKESIYTVGEPELTPFGGSGIYSVYSATIIVERNFLYFIHHIILPIILLVCMCCLTFCTFNAKLIDKLFVSITCFLSLLAIKFAIALDLPHISYSTIIDQIFLFSYFCIGLIMVIHVACNYIKQTNKNLARKINNNAPWLLISLILFKLIWILFFP